MRAVSCRADLGPGWYSYLVLPGRQVLAIQEIMHATGFGHVTDCPSIMYPQCLTNAAAHSVPALSRACARCIRVTTAHTSRTDEERQDRQVSFTA